MRRSIKWLGLSLCLAGAIWLTANRASELGLLSLSIGGLLLIATLENK